MPANKYALLRYRIIDRCLRNTAMPYPGKEELRLACEESLYGSGSNRISGSTIEKDIWAMRNESELGYYAPIEYDPKHRGYYYQDPTYSIAEISLNDEDLAAIRYAALTLEQFKDVPMLAEYKNAIQKVIDRLNVAPAENSDLSVLVQFEKEINPKGTENTAPIIHALEHRRVIEIRYKKFGESALTHYRLEPLLLKEYKNMWYLIAFNRKKGKIATFGLDRIFELTQTAEHFTYPSDFDAANYFANAVGITVGNAEPLLIRARFAARWFDYLMAHPIHSGQKCIEMDGSFFTVELTVTESSELYGILMGFGADVVVESPPEVRGKLVELITAALANYKN